MRSAAVAVALAVGCGPSVRPPGLPDIEPGNLIDADTYTRRIAGLRATLSRSHVELDGEPVLRFCGSHHNVDRCVRCDVASRRDTAGVDPEMIDGVAIAFGRYPTSVLAAAKLERVALCRKIRYEGEEGHGDDPAGVAIPAERRLLVSIEHFVGRQYDDGDYFTIEQVVHHELFHMLDAASLGDAVYTDKEWSALNPPGFAYVEVGERPVERPRGFVDSYAITNGLEDRASTYEYLMGHPTRLCELAEADPIVAAKTAVVWKRVAQVMGEALLRRHAPCWMERKRAPEKPVKSVRTEKARGPEAPPSRSARTNRPAKPVKSFGPQLRDPADPAKPRKSLRMR